MLTVLVGKMSDVAGGVFELGDALLPRVIESFSNSSG